MRALAISLALIAVGAARIVSTYSAIGITYDEPAHLACGMQFLADHTYSLEPQHPPLARVACALGPYLAGVRPAGQSNMVAEGVAEIYQDGRVPRNLFLSRLGILPFFILACLVVYTWTRRYFGELAAVFACGLLTLLPPVLAHAGLGTTDMALAACLGAAFLALLLWAEQPVPKNAVILGIACGAAVLAKFTALVFLPAAGVLALVCTLTAVTNLRQRALSLGIAAAVAAAVIHTGYLFSFGEVPGWNLWLPAPEFFQGLQQAARHNSQGHLTWFLGEMRWTGWWYFFPVMLLVKTPIGFLALAAAGLVVCWRNRKRLPYAMPLAFILGPLLVAMAGRVNIGIRHVLPVYLGLSILAGLGLELLWRSGRAARAAGAVLVLWVAVSGIVHHPDYISYFNELAPHPENIAVDSDLEWGQDTVLLARRFGDAAITCSFWNLTPEQLRAWPGLNCSPLDPRVPAHGWIAVSPTNWRISQYGLEHSFPGVEPWFVNLRPMERVGGMLLYQVP